VDEEEEDDDDGEGGEAVPSYLILKILSVRSRYFPTPPVYDLRVRDWVSHLQKSEDKSLFFIL
jgi:hypothetical protein